MTTQNVSTSLVNFGQSDVIVDEREIVKYIGPSKVQRADGERLDMSVTVQKDWYWVRFSGVVCAKHLESLKSFNLLHSKRRNSYHIEMSDRSLKFLRDILGATTLSEADLKTVKMEVHDLPTPTTNPTYHPPVTIQIDDLPVNRKSEKELEIPAEPRRRRRTTTTSQPKSKPVQKRKIGPTENLQAAADIITQAKARVAKLEADTLKAKSELEAARELAKSELATIQSLMAQIAAALA